MESTVRTIDYFYAKVGDQPGEGRRLLEHLSEKGVNLLAFTAYPIGDGQAQLDFLPESPEALQGAAADAGISLVGPRNAFLIQGQDRVGALHEQCLKLSNAGVNIVAANGVVDGNGGFGIVLWVRSKDQDRAAEALGV